MQFKNFRESRISDVVCIEQQKISDKGAFIKVYEKYDTTINLKRFFIVEVDKAQTRGGHAHFDANQIFCVLKGKVIIQVDDGINIKEYSISDSDLAYLVPRGIWSTQNYEQNAILMVITDTFYDEKDYIRNYESFLIAKGIQ